MNNVITVTFDGQVLTPEIPLYLSQNKKYKIAIIVIPIKIGTFQGKKNLDLEAQTSEVLKTSEVCLKVLNCGNFILNDYISDENTPETQQNAWDILEDLAGTYEGPQDWSSEHNHYLYGTAKQDLTNVFCQPCCVASRRVIHYCKQKNQDDFWREGLD